MLGYPCCTSEAFSKKSWMKKAFCHELGLKILNWEKGERRTTNDFWVAVDLV